MEGAGKACPQCVRPVVVGISGPSRSGKTTLVSEWQALRREGDHRACGVVHQDLFFVQAEEAPWEEVETETGQKLSIANWEVPESIRWQDLIAAVNRLVADCTRKCKTCLGTARDEAGERLASSLPAPVVFVEGFLLFARRELLQLFDKRVLVLIGRDQARQRRLRTSGTTGFYFDRFIWPHCLDYTRRLLLEKASAEPPGRPNGSVLLLSGEDDMSQNVQRLAAFVDGDKEQGEMTDGAARLVEQLLRADESPHVAETPPVEMLGHLLSGEQRSALKLYRDAEVLEAYGKREEATALYRRALRMWPEVEEAASQDNHDEDL